MSELNRLKVEATKRAFARLQAEYEGRLDTLETMRREYEAIIAEIESDG